MAVHRLIRTTITFCILWCAAVALQSDCPTRASTATTGIPAEQQAFQVVLSRLDHAEMNHDIDTWAKIIRQNSAPNAAFADHGRVETISQTIADERASFDNQLAIKIDSERIVSMTFFGNTAHATATYSLDMQSPTGGPDIAVSDLISFHLIRINGKWLIKSITLEPEPSLGGASA
jgi:hypothetical protein